MNLKKKIIDNWQNGGFKFILLLNGLLIPQRNLAHLLKLLEIMNIEMAQEKKLFQRQFKLLH